MKVLVDRDSVAAGDDVEPHNREFEVRAESSVGQLFTLVKPDASITGGRATWLVVVSTAGTAGSPPNRIVLGVYAQEWGAVRFFGSAGARLDELAPGAEVLNAARYLSSTATEAIEGFGAVIALHSSRYLRCDLPTRNGPLSAIVQAHDTMAGVSLNGKHLANFRPVLHAEQFLVALVGDAWRVDTGRPPVVLPPVTGHIEVSPGQHLRSWFGTWKEGEFRLDGMMLGLVAPWATSPDSRRRPPPSIARP